MNSSTALALIGIVLAVTACGRVVAEASDPATTDDPSAERSDAAGARGAASAQDVDAGTSPLAACPPPPRLTSLPPAGCSTNDGTGWVVAPCTCELWTTNSSPSPVTA